MIPCTAELWSSYLAQHFACVNSVPIWCRCVCKGASCSKAVLEEIKKIGFRAVTVENSWQGVQEYGEQVSHETPGFWHEGGSFRSMIYSLVVHQRTPASHLKSATYDKHASTTTTGLTCRDHINTIEHHMLALSSTYFSKKPFIVGRWNHCKVAAIVRRQVHMCVLN